MKSTAKNVRNKRQEKKQINIQWNSRLFFQIGIIVSLLTVFFRNGKYF
jgi:protein TonB